MFRFAGDQPGRPIVVTGLQGVFDRLVGPVLVFIPDTGFYVQPCDLVGLIQGQAEVEKVPEKFVVAIPGPPFIERDQEQVGFFQRLENLLAAAPPQ